VRNAWGMALTLLAAVALSGCSSKTASLDPFAGKGSPMYKGKGPIPKGGGRYHVGNSYQIAGRWFTPKEQADYDKVGTASWYGPQFHRRMTSNGEWFDMDYLTAAHPTLPLPSYARVTNLENGRQIVVRINDRGPFVGDRIIDLSKKSAEILGFKTAGKAQVRVKYLGPAPLDDNGTHLMAMNRNLKLGTEPPVMVAKAPEPPAPKLAAASVASLASLHPAPAGGEYFVQVGSFADPDNAQRTREQLAQAGPVQILPLSGNQGVLYRVRIGPLSDQREAETALSAAVSAGHADARLIVANLM
jgi:rare lipoprotein A